MTALAKADEATYSFKIPASHVAVIMDLLTSAPMPMRTSYPVYSGLNAQIQEQDAARDTPLEE